MRKETVIVVHGTWAEPRQGQNPWYYWDSSDPNGFVSKLDTALRERGSPARCWAHWPQYRAFQWSGENSWIARTQAASALVEYVGKLCADGWRCHIVAHSHGGNVVLEALPQLLNNLDQLGRIVTLGTPFMNTISPISDVADRRSRSLSAVSEVCFWGLVVIFCFFTAGFWYVLVFVVGRFIVRFNKKTVANAQAAMERADQIGYQMNLIAKRGGIVLAMNSSMDEAWQILHHIQNLESPIAVRSSLFSYVFASARNSISLFNQVARIRGARSYPDLTVGRTLTLFSVYTILCLLVWWIFALVSKGALGGEVAVAGVFGGVLYIIVIGLTRILGKDFHSAFWSPFRFFWRVVASSSNVPGAIVTYLIRNSAWRILQAMTMGLEGYRFKTPIIEKCPSWIRKDLVKYEDLPKVAEERALAVRNDWVNRNLGHVSQAFSKFVVTEADISSLLRKIEADQSLVHAAYYTDGECIARIANWIVGR
jgi:hypothetical protein